MAEDRTQDQLPELLRALAEAESTTTPVGIIDLQEEFLSRCRSMSSIDDFAQFASIVEDYWLKRFDWRAQRLQRLLSKMRVSAALDVYEEAIETIVAEETDAAAVDLETLRRARPWPAALVKKFDALAREVKRSVRKPRARIRIDPPMTACIPASRFSP